MVRASSLPNWSWYLLDPFSSSNQSFHVGDSISSQMFLRQINPDGWDCYQCKLIVNLDGSKLNLRLPRILRVGLFAAIITAIVGSSLIGNAIMDSSMMNTVNSLRRASMILSMGESTFRSFWHRRQHALTNPCSCCCCRLCGNIPHPTALLSHAS